ncbi:MAG: tetraacyldisaccharide 4'-kinase [candidate division Zixibacteria bacterium]|nr:tetraacyldisaccharide 4'-kinase [candidate division Zixibacteria bacterium]NIR62976.1 tetraacyldisaccharide 4'-kinase [candidate division Zixibacteria bacterium]NIS16163.1 tetraacyldisaccharide 4'-kinase [candidate division Zixibacteria bacterium]NIS44997.1 tetraacyldisaccharide 4'-kinase [candidate division Zixibacteria bacterium]NIT52559.1 tetraacyldisaccharide 4'-kinase [candidate division Zixibacteria bacterium]
MKKHFGLVIQDYLNHPQSGVFKNVISILLLPLSLLYFFLMIVRRQFYEMRIFRSKKLDHPVISVGNLTTGGTGKTPFEIYLIKMMNEMNIRPLILSHGYGSKSPDEMSMIAEQFPEIPIAYGKNRLSSYKKAAAEYEFDIVILDDGFQHLKIKRDLDIIILDAHRPFGSGRLLPSGNLREPKSILRYGDLIVLNYKAEKIDRKNHSSEMVRNWEGLSGGYKISGIDMLHGGNRLDLSGLAANKCGIITAIGDSESFRYLLEKKEVKIAKVFRFRDHHEYTKEDLKLVQESCLAESIEHLFTTEKDAVKLKTICFENPSVYVIKIAFRLEKGEDHLKQRIQALAKRQS